MHAHCPFSPLWRRSNATHGSSQPGRRLASIGLFASFLLASYFFRPKSMEYGSATRNIPANMFPSETGSRFWSRNCAQDTLAPAKMPAGMMNMLATECSNPNVTKAEMGNQMAMALPAVSFGHRSDVHRHTHQPVAQDAPHKDRGKG